MPSIPLHETGQPDLGPSWSDGLNILRSGDDEVAGHRWLSDFVRGHAVGRDRSALLLWSLVRQAVGTSIAANLRERLDGDRQVCEDFVKASSLYEIQDVPNRKIDADRTRLAREQAVRLLAGSFSVAKAALLWKDTSQLATSLQTAVAGYASFWLGREVTVDASQAKLASWSATGTPAWEEAQALVSRMTATETDDNDAVAVGRAMVYYALGWLLDVLPVPSDADRRQTSVIFAYGAKGAALARLQLDRCPWQGAESVLFPDPMSLGLRLLDEDWRRSFERARKAGIDHGPQDRSPASGDVAWRLVFATIPPLDERPDSDALPPDDPRDVLLLAGPSASGAAALAWAALANGRPLDACVCLTADVKASGALFAVGGLSQKLNGENWVRLRQSLPVQAVLVGWKNQELDKDEAHERDWWQSFGNQAGLRVGFPKLLTEVIDEACGRLEAVLTFLDQLALNGLKEHVIYLPPKLKSGEGDPDQPDSNVTLTDLTNFCLPVRVVDEQEWQRLERERSSPKPTHGPDDRDYIFAQSEEFWRMDGEQRATPRRLETVLATNRRTVLRGEPGEGKTTSLFLHVARCCRELADNLRKGSLGLDNAECRVPLPLPLSKAAPTKSGQRFSAVRRARNDALRLAFGSAKRAPPEVTEWLKEKVTRGEINLCLDALDELDVRWHDGLRKELERHSAAGVFLTTRLSADDSKVLRNARRYRMVCFGPAQVRDYTQRYFAHIEKGEQFAGELRDRLRQSPGPRQLAQIPLLLALLCEWLSSRREWPIEKLREEMPKTRTKLLEFALHRLMERGDARRGNPVADSPSQRNKIKEAILRHVAWGFFATGPLPILKHDLLPMLEQQLELLKWKGYAPPQNAEELLEEYLRDGVFVRQDQGEYRFVLRCLHEYCLAGWIANESPPIIANDRAAFERMIRGRVALWADLRNRTGDIKPLNQPSWRAIWPLAAGVGKQSNSGDWLHSALRAEYTDYEDVGFGRLGLAATVVSETPHAFNARTQIIDAIIYVLGAEGRNRSRPEI